MGGGGCAGECSRNGSKEGRKRAEQWFRQSEGTVGLSRSQSSFTRCTGWEVSAGEVLQSGFCKAGNPHAQGAIARTLQSHYAETLVPGNERRHFLRTETRTVLNFTQDLI